MGASSVEYYGEKSNGIPGWEHVLFVATLKRGSLYVLPLKANRKEASGAFRRYFQSENRYRDTAVSPDGKTIYIATDPAATGIYQCARAANVGEIGLAPSVVQVLAAVEKLPP